MGAGLEPPGPRGLSCASEALALTGEARQGQRGLSLTSHRGHLLTFPWRVLTSTPSKCRVLTDTDTPLGGTNPQIKVQVPLRRLTWDAAFLTSHCSAYT